VSVEKLNYVWRSLQDFFWGNREANFNMVLPPFEEDELAAHELTGSSSSSKSKSGGAKSAEEHEEVAEEEKEEEDIAFLSKCVLKVKLGEAPDPTGLQAAMKHSLGLFSAAGFPTFTNYIPSFKELLDYVFVQRAHFEVLGVAPFPEEALLQRYTALPSCVMPSDHISVLVDLRLR
jgi:hypothetical protein